jgi:5-methylcytosine-specific restriction endonuclease McrA
MTKKCTKCLEIKDLGDFSKNSKNKTDGRQPKCKRCNKLYYQENNAKINKRIRGHYNKNKKEILKRRAELRKRPEAKKKKAELNTEHYKKNKNKIAKYHKWWSKKNRDGIRKNHKAWRTKNPEKARANRRASGHKRREWCIINGNNTLTSKDVYRLLRTSDNCFYCKKLCEEKHIDHIIPVSRGGQNCLENVVVACTTCNLNKGNKLISEWRPGF